MSLLFHRKTKKAMGYVWIVLSIIIILSMVVTYTGLSRVAVVEPQTPPVQTEQTPSASTTPQVVVSTTTPPAPAPVQKLQF